MPQHLSWYSISIGQLYSLSCTTSLCCVLANPYMCSDCRFIVFRRVFLILSLLYLMRAITMYITVLPVASKTYYCSPKANQTSAYLVTTRVLQLISGFGLSVNGKHTYCGDYIYSGHTVVLVLSYLLISECKLTVNINNILTIFPLSSW